MSDNHAFPHANAFEAFGEETSVYLCPKSIARISAAVQGCHALVAILGQREISAEMDVEAPASFSPAVAQGVLSALACCIELIEGATNGTIFPTAMSVSAGTPEHEFLSRAAFEAGRMQRTRTAPSA